MNKQFSPQEFILIAYEPKNHPLFSQKTFTDIQALSEKFRTLPRVATLNNDLQGLGLQQGSYSLTNLFVLYQDIYPSPKES